MVTLLLWPALANELCWLETQDKLFLRHSFLPDARMNRHIRCRRDVYAFGVVILEVTGRRKACTYDISQEGDGSCGLHMEEDR